MVSADSSWHISQPRTLDFDTPVESLHVRMVSGAVNVVGSAEPASRIEISEVDGPPLAVRREGSALVVAYDDLPWKGFLKWLDRKGWHRGAVVSISVPARARLSVGVVGAGAVISGIRGRTDIRGVSGETTLVGLSGPVRADTVSGGVEAQALTGELRFHSVSGDLTVVDGGGSAVRADSVSGDMIVDLRPVPHGTDIALTTVSGEIAVRIPHPGNTTVEAGTAGGTLCNAFDELAISGQWGAKRLTGTLGSGSGSLRASTVSGPLSLLRRPPMDGDAPPCEEGALPQSEDARSAASAFRKEV